MNFIIIIVITITIIIIVDCLRTLQSTRFRRRYTVSILKASLNNPEGKNEKRQLFNKYVYIMASTEHPALCYIW
jgi:hypothetical protein